MRFLQHCISQGHQVSDLSPRPTNSTPYTQTYSFADFLLALCPPNIDPSSLSVMVAFAVGGLLGDTIFHLLPEIFLGEASPDEARFVLVNPNKNLLLGVVILVGFVTFVAMDKGLRIATGGGGHNHNHGHEHDLPIRKEKDISAEANASGANIKTPNKNSLKSRKTPAGIPTIPDDLLKLILTYGEPERAEYFLRAVMEIDPEHNVTQISLWQAYQAQCEEPHLPAAKFIHNVGNIFAHAKPIKCTSGLNNGKFVIRGIRPRSSALTKEEFEATVIRPLGNKNSSLSDRAGEANPSPSSTSIKLSAYLNLIADFTHNITDGLALSSSFYASPTLGATTTVAVFFHEIPHEVGDFALLIQSGFSKKRAMGAQFVTALGAFLGTFLGIVVQEFGKTSSKGDGAVGVSGRGLAGTGLSLGDLLLPFTAGTFLYVGTVAVIPELLETGGTDKRAEVRKTTKQFVAMAAGAGIMLA